MGFKKFLKENYTKISKFSLPIVSMGIGKRKKKIEESIIPHNKAKKLGLFNKHSDHHIEKKVSKFHDRNRKRSDMLHALYYDHEENQDDLPHHVQSALHSYSNGSQDTNRALYQQHVGRGEIDDYDRGNIDDIDEAMRRRKLHGGIVYTGIGTKIHSNIGEMLKRGVVHNPSYTSTSHNIRTASSFADKDKDETQHVLEIHLPKDHPGVYMPRYSEWDDEKETLLPRGMSFKIHKNPRIYKDTGGSIYHVWKAHPVSKEEVENEHNKRMNKMLENGNVSELKNYYDHEATENDKKVLHAIKTSNPEKQLEYFGDKRNHGLLAANPNLRDDIKEILENSNTPGIQKYFAQNTSKPELLDKFLKRGHHIELSKNENIDSDQAREIIEKSGGHKKVLNNLIKSLERTGSSVEHDKKLDEVMPLIVKHGDDDIKRRLTNKYFYRSDSSPHTGHLDHLIDNGDDKLHAHLIQQRATDLTPKQKKDLFSKASEENKQYLIPHLSVVHLRDMIKNGTDEDRERIAKNVMGYTSSGEDEIIKMLADTKNPKIIKHVKDKISYLPYSKDSHELFHPAKAISLHDIKKYIDDPKTHHLLIHNSDLANSDIKELIDKNPSLVNHMFHTGINYDGDVLSHVLKYKKHLDPESNVLMMHHSLKYNKPKQDMINHIKKNDDQPSKDVLKFKYGIE